MYLLCPQTITTKKSKDGTSLQHGVLCYCGRSNTNQHWFAIWLRFGQKFFNVAFCSYLNLQFFNWAAVLGERNSNFTPAQSAIVSGKKFELLEQLST
jgi:hypothetical protein